LSRTEIVLDGREQPLDVLGFRQVRGDRSGFAIALRVAQPHRLLERFRSSRTDNDCPSCFAEGDGRGSANSGRRSGDKRNAWLSVFQGHPGEDLTVRGSTDEGEGIASVRATLRFKVSMYL
jgi:hypothetical protein